MYFNTHDKYNVPYSENKEHYGALMNCDML